MPRHHGNEAQVMATLGLSYSVARTPSASFLFLGESRGWWACCKIRIEDKLKLQAAPIQLSVVKLALSLIRNPLAVKLPLA